MDKSLQFQQNLAAHPLSRDCSTLAHPAVRDPRFGGWQCPVLLRAEGATSKTLLLVRHAKSSWDDPGVADQARPLNKRGTRDAAAMARRVAHRPNRPELIVTSPALRAHRTAEAMAAALGLEAELLVVDERVYDATTADLLDVIRSLDDRHARVMLVGHHPGITDMVNLLTDANLEKLPTCGVAAVRLDVRSWADVHDGGAELIELDAPKNHPQ